MPLEAECPQCAAPVLAGPEGWSCPEHGAAAPLWRTTRGGYDDFAEHLRRAGESPTWLPLPWAATWRVSDFAVLGEGGSATLLALDSATARGPDGPVELIVLCEEHGSPLGHRVTGARLDQDPSGGPVALRVGVGQRSVPMWLVPTAGARPAHGRDRSVLIGSVLGRRLWLVVSPAAAVLGLAGLVLVPAAEVGPALVDLEFGGPAPAW